MYTFKFKKYQNYVNKNKIWNDMWNMRKKYTLNMKIYMKLLKKVNFYDFYANIVKKKFVIFYNLNKNILFWLISYKFLFNVYYFLYFL